MRAYFLGFYQRHQLFLLIFILFIAFRGLAIVLFRPGGFIADFSDRDFYYAWGELTPRGYQAYDNLWAVYPPLFPALMQWIFEMAARIPPWIEPRLFFHTLLGLALLFFEAGNLLLIYRLAAHLSPGAAPSQPALFLPPLLYALLFAPVYTLLGWFESMPLFFMLLGLDLLLWGRERPAGWMLSAVAVALGFLTKLTPALLVPIAMRWLGSRLSLAAARGEWFNRQSSGNLLRPLLYLLIFAGAVVVVGYPFVRENPALALSSFRVQDIRPPWQSLWAVIDGYFGYGLVPLDMRNLAGLEGPLWESQLPWGWITVGFLLLYLWLYTRPYDWRSPHTPVVFAAVSVIWLFLYSKGWSPQFVIWVLGFTVLLLPTLRGVAIAVALTVINFIEANVFLIFLPDQRWILWGTVLARTVLLILLTAEFLGQIWPEGRGRSLRRLAAVGSWATLALAVIALGITTPQMARAYAERRLAEHPCREAVAYLQQEAPWPADLIATADMDGWHFFYPWLRGEYDLRVVDDYSPGRPPAEVRVEHLAALVAGEASFWWLEMDGAQTNPAASPAMIEALASTAVAVQSVETQQFGACQLSHVVQLPRQPLAVADVRGGPIELLQVQSALPDTGSALYLVLYWRAQAPVAERYTIFTQLFNPQGELVAQQDNWPVQGLAPTDTWQPGVVVRDTYRLPLPAEADPGSHRLSIGLYTAQGRQTLTLDDGRQSDSVEIEIGRLGD
jgi:hypothetical protein